jgi:hypothetical protein
VVAVATYPDLVRRALNRVAGFLRAVPKPGVETLVIEDASHECFLLKRLGWHNHNRVTTTVVFVRLKDGKIWVEEDGTEEGIATELLAAGVPKSDIVLAFHAPEERRFGEFAVG